MTQAKLEELRLRHPAVGCAYRLGMYFDTISSLPYGFDALPENDGYSSYFEETDFEEDALSELMFAKIPGDSASVVDMQVAEQVLLSREKKTQRTCHATYRPTSFIKYQSSEDNGLTARMTAYNKNSIIYTAASSGYGTALLSPQSSSQPEYGTWNSKDFYDSQNSQYSEPSIKQNITEVGMIKSPAKTSYRSKPLPPTPIELQRSEMKEKSPPFSNQKLFDIRRSKPCSSRNVFRPPGITGSVQTLGSQASIISGDYSRPWDLIRKPSVTKYSSSKCDVNSGRAQATLKHSTGKAIRSSSAVPSQLVKPGAKSKREFGKYLEDEAEHIYESITDVDNDYEEVPEEVLPSPSVRGLNQTVHSFSNTLDVSPSMVSRSTNNVVIPLSAISSVGKPVKKDKTTKKSPKSMAIVTSSSHTIGASANPFGSIKKKGNGKRRATFPDTTFKCSDKPRGSQPIINYGVV